VGAQAGVDRKERSMAQTHTLSTEVSTTNKYKHFMRERSILGCTFPLGFDVLLSQGHHLNMSSHSSSCCTGPHTHLYMV